MKGRAAKKEVTTRAGQFPATFSRRSRRSFRRIGDATTPDGTAYVLMVHRSKHFPALLHVERDQLIELTWDFLITFTDGSVIPSLPSDS